MQSQISIVTSSENIVTFTQVTVGDTSEQPLVQHTSHVESDSDSSDADPSWKPMSEETRKKPGRKKGSSMVSISWKYV